MHLPALAKKNKKISRVPVPTNSKTSCHPGSLDPGNSHRIHPFTQVSVLVDFVSATVLQGLHREVGLARGINPLEIGPALLMYLATPADFLFRTGAAASLEISNHNGRTSQEIFEVHEPTSFPPLLSLIHPHLTKFSLHSLCLPGPKRRNHLTSPHQPTRLEVEPHLPGPYPHLTTTQHNLSTTTIARARPEYPNCVDRIRKTHNAPREQPRLRE